MNCSMPGVPVHHQLPEFTQTHVYWVGDAIPPSHPLSSPSPPASNPSQHQSHFQWVNSSFDLLLIWKKNYSVKWQPDHFYSSTQTLQILSDSKGKESAHDDLPVFTLFILFHSLKPTSHVLSSSPPSATATLVVLLFFEQTGCVPFKNASTLSSGFLDGSVVKNPPANAGGSRDMGSIPGSEDSLE